jgi:hypothetical protein
MTLAFSLGLAAALLAWGPVGWNTGAAPAAASSADALGWVWTRWWSAPQIWAAALLIALAVWVQFLFARCQRRVCDVAWPWRLLVLMAAVRACLWVGQSGAMANGSLTAVQFSAQFSQAGLGVVLCWGLMAERFKTQCNVWLACLVCVGLLAVATLWCLLVPGATTPTRDGDARAFLLLQLMPVVLVVAGILRLPERGLSRGESMCLVAAYLATWLTTWLPVLSHVLAFPRAELLIATLPWVSYCALCLLALVPTCNLRQAQQSQLLGAARSERRSLAPAWLPHFKFDTLAAPNRRHNV